jgi:hypothetical protein
VNAVPRNTLLPARTREPQALVAQGIEHRFPKSIWARVPARPSASRRCSARCLLGHRWPRPTVEIRDAAGFSRDDRLWSDRCPDTSLAPLPRPRDNATKRAAHREPRSATAPHSKRRGFASRHLHQPEFGLSRPRDADVMQRDTRCSGPYAKPPARPLRASGRCGERARHTLERERPARGSRPR